MIVTIMLIVCIYIDIFYDLKKTILYSDIEKLFEEIITNKYNGRNDNR